MQLLRILASSLLLASLALAQGGARPVHLAVVTIRDAATLDKLMALDLDLAGRNALELPVREVEVIADDAELQRMTAAGLRYRVEVRDLEKTIGDRLARYQMPMSLTPSVGQGAMGGHYTLAQMGGDPRRVRAQAPGDLHPKGQPWQVAREPRHLDDQDLR
jgi:hypothetical protein